MPRISLQRRLSPADGSGCRGSAADSTQGDLGFVRALEQMGARVFDDRRRDRGDRSGRRRLREGSRST